MNLRPLLDSDANELERALLRAGAGEEPPRDGPARLAHALGLDATGLAASSEAADTPARHSAGADGTSIAPSPGAPPTFGSQLLLTAYGAKWWLVAGASLLALGGAWSLSRRAPAETARESHAANALAPHAPVAPASAASPAHPAPTAPATATPANASATAATSIADEVALMEHVRALLRGQRAREALRALDRYDAQQKDGVLREEAEAMRIEAWFAVGASKRAREHARRFFAAHPSGVHNARLRALLEPRGE